MPSPAIGKGQLVGEVSDPPETSNGPLGYRPRNSRVTSLAKSVAG